jgi:hypothetical protein
VKMWISASRHDDDRAGPDRAALVAVPAPGAALAVEPHPVPGVMAGKAGRCPRGDCGPGAIDGDGVSPGPQGDDREGRTVPLVAVPARRH